MCLSTAVNTVVAWLLHRKTDVSGPGWWAVGTGCVSFGLFLISFRGMLGGLLDIAVANGLIMTGYAVVWNGMRRFAGRPFSKVVFCFCCALVAGAFAGNLWFSVFTPSLNARIVVNALTILMFSIAIGNTLLGAKFESRSVTYTGAAYSLNGILNGIRLIGLVVGPSLTTYMNSGGFMALYLLLSIVFSVAVTVGQVCMVREDIGGNGDRSRSAENLLC